MTHPLVERRLSTQEGLVSSWQLRGDGASPDAIRHAITGLREVHDGVHASGHAALTELQQWRAATLTAPNTALAFASAGTFHGFFEHRGPAVTVVRPGSGGPQQFGRLLVCRSNRLKGEIAWYDGMPVTTPARTALDLIGTVARTRGDRIVREALRIAAVTDEDLVRAVIRHKGRRGVASLRAFAAEYSGLPATRCRSDAELLGLAILRNAGLELPGVNVKIAGHAADYSWPDRRVIIELDGPDFHRYPTHDLRIQQKWERAGWRVYRLSTDDVYHRPDLLIALAVRANVRRAGP